MARPVRASDADKWDDESPTVDLFEETLPPMDALRAVGHYYSNLWKHIWGPTGKFFRRVALGITIFLAITSPTTFWLLQGRRNVPVGHLLLSAVIPITIVIVGAFFWYLIAAPARFSRGQNRLIFLLMQGSFDMRDEAEDAERFIQLYLDLRYLQGHAEGYANHYSGDASVSLEIARGKLDEWLGKVRIALDRGGLGSLFQEQFQAGRRENSLESVPEIALAFRNRAHAIDSLLDLGSPLCKKWRPEGHYFKAELE